MVSEVTHHLDESGEPVAVSQEAPLPVTGMSDRELQEEILTELRRLRTGIEEVLLEARFEGA